MNCCIRKLQVVCLSPAEQTMGQCCGVCVGGKAPREGKQTTYFHESFDGERAGAGSSIYMKKTAFILKHSCFVMCCFLSNVSVIVT